MWEGAVVSVHVAPSASAPMQEVSEARAVPGQGIAGDRYAQQIGTFSPRAGPDRELTLIEIEAVEALTRDYGVEIAPAMRAARSSPEA